MNEWHYPPEVPKKQAQYLVEVEYEDMFCREGKKRKVFNVEGYFIISKDSKSNNRTGWQFHTNPDGSEREGLLRWMEIPE